MPPPAHADGGWCCARSRRPRCCRTQVQGGKDGGGGGNGRCQNMQCDLSGSKTFAAAAAAAAAVVDAGLAWAASSRARIHAARHWPNYLVCWLQHGACPPAHAADQVVCAIASLVAVGWRHNHIMLLLLCATRRLTDGLPLPPLLHACSSTALQGGHAADSWGLYHCPLT
jgi:hypothetical protein